MFRDGASVIELERREDGIVVLTLAHGKANVMDLELCSLLADTLDELGAEPVPALVLTGRGRIFCAGVDLIRLLEGGVEYVRVFLPELQRVLRAALSFPAPMVAALNGHSVAGGCLLAAAADRRLLADSGGRVGVPELRVGVPFPPEAIELMRELLPPSRFRTLVIGGAMLDGGAAYDWGLVDEVVEPERLLEHALRVARDLASIPAGAFHLTKRLMREPALARIDEANRAGGAALLRGWTDSVTTAAVRAHVERTLRGRPG
jgi:enoyl-CoA hydratase